MSHFDEIKSLIFDFDGVIIDSLKVREFGFRQIFKSFDTTDVDKLISFHRSNGGLSRFVKISYFFKEILRRELTNDKLYFYARKYSEIMRAELNKTNFLITDTISFIKDQNNNFEFHIASGSEHNELNDLCATLKIKEFFISINGSPLRKASIISSIMEKHEYSPDQIVMIGDSVNDYHAALENEIRFFGYNNPELKLISDLYIDSFSELILN